MNPIAEVTKHLQFGAAHFLVNHEWDVAKNRAAFHACSLYKDDEGTIQEPHGHTYHLEVTVRGEIDEGTGFVIDFKDLKRILEDGIVKRMDHRLLNNIEYFQKTKKSPTVENILHYIWGEICMQIDELRPGLAWLQQVKVWETPNSFGILTKELAGIKEEVPVKMGGHVPSLIGTDYSLGDNFAKSVKR